MVPAVYTPPCCMPASSANPAHSILPTADGDPKTPHSEHRRRGRHGPPSPYTLRPCKSSCEQMSHDNWSPKWSPTWSPMSPNMPHPIRVVLPQCLCCCFFDQTDCWRCSCHGVGIYHDIPPPLSNPHQKIKGFVKFGNIISSNVDMLGFAFLESGIQVSQVTCSSP